MEELGPEFDCPTCSIERRSEYDPPRGCPDCPLTESYNTVLEGVVTRAGRRTVAGFKTEIARRYARRVNGKLVDENEWPFLFSIREVQLAYAYASGLLGDSNGEIRPEWDETTGQLARIVLERRAVARFEALWTPKPRG